LFVVYEIRRHVFPTAPSPTTTHLWSRRTHVSPEQMPKDFGGLEIRT
jgi:hypothetical protein